MTDDPDQYLADGEARRQEMREEFWAAPAPQRPRLAQRFKGEMAQEARQARRALTESVRAQRALEAQAAQLRSVIAEVDAEGGRFIEATAVLELRGLAVLEDHDDAPPGAATFVLTPRARAIIDQWRAAVIDGEGEPDVDGLGERDVETLLLFESEIDDRYRFFVRGAYG